VTKTAATLLLCAALAAPLSAQTSLRIDGSSVPVERVQGQLLISAAALAPLGGQWRADGWQAQLRIFGDTITFFSHSPFLRLRGQTDQLVQPVILSGTALWLPLQFFTEWLPAIYPTRLTYRDGALNRVAVAARPAPAGRGTRIVVLDPGHGGRDPGKPGPNGLLEKNAALAVTNRLAGFLRDRGYEVHLTRSRDTLIALADRPHLANEWKNGRAAAVFISIHANSGVRGARGFETYFLSSARTDDERRVAEMENAAVDFEERKATDNAPELDLILSG
jgi:N-acetylmuramoyl-L-alanine amidase